VSESLIVSPVCMPSAYKRIGSSVERLFVKMGEAE
jgi:hypothetical protein